MVFLAKELEKDSFSSDEFNIETWPFYWIVGTSALYLEALHGEVSKGKLDITMWRVLMIMPKNGRLDVGTLAKKAVTKRPTMSRILRRMEESGYIAMNPVYGDKRIREVELTESGWNLKKIAKRHADNISKLALKNISTQELSSLMKILSKLQKNL